MNELLDLEYSSRFFLGISWYGRKKMANGSYITTSLIAIAVEILFALSCTLTHIIYYCFFLHDKQLGTHFNGVGVCGIICNLLFVIIDLIQ